MRIHPTLKHLSLLMLVHSCISKVHVGVEDVANGLLEESAL